MSDLIATPRMHQALERPVADTRGALEIAALGVAITIAFAIQSFVTLIGGVALCALFVLRHRRLLGIDGRVATKALLAGLLFAPAFVKPDHGVSPIFYLAATYVSFATAYVISRFSADAIHRAATLIYWTLTAIVAAILAAFWGTPEPFGEVIEGTSTNGIPAYMIIVQLLLCVTTLVVTGRAPVITPVITFMIAFFGNGRGSLVVGSLLIAGSLLINLFPRKVPFIYRAALIALSVFAMFQLAIHATELYDYVSRYTKLSVGIQDQNRALILRSYLNVMDPYTLIFGAEYRGTVIDTIYLGNPHISYIRTHSFFGIFPTLLAIFSPLVIVFSRGPWLLKLPIASFTALAALRAATEPVLFPTLLDVFYFLMFFVYFRARRAADRIDV